MKKGVFKLGTIGETTATLYNKDNKVIGYCLDTPNCIAVALQVYPQITKVIGLLGSRNIKETREIYVSDKNYHLKNIKINVV
jgi:hypothetical protein